MYELIDVVRLLTARGKIIVKWDYLFLKHLHMFEEW